MGKAPIDEPARPVAMARLAHRPWPNRAEGPRGVALLTNWRMGAFAAATVIAGLFPFAIAWRVSYVIAMAAAMVFAAAIAVGCHLARRSQLYKLAVDPELAELPELVATRRRLQTTRTRRALAAALRQAAAPIQPPRRFDCCPVLADRVAEVRDEIFALADELERAVAPDPESVALIRALLTSGTGPLYNPNLPAEHLRATVAHARAGLAGPRTPRRLR